MDEFIIMISVNTDLSLYTGQDPQVNWIVQVQEWVVSLL